MAMRKRKSTGLNFDLDSAEETLARWLIENDSETERRCGRLNPRADVAHVHREKHGSIRDDACTVTPCRKEAVCVALAEIETFRASTTGSVAELASVLIGAGQLLRPADIEKLRFAKATARRLENEHLALARHMRPDLVRPTCWPDVENAVALLALAITNVQQVAGEVLGNVESVAVQRDLTRRTGPKGGELLHALRQILNKGGFSPTEIARLIRDDTPTDANGGRQRADRVRKSLKQPAVATLDLWSATEKRSRPAVRKNSPP